MRRPNILFIMADQLRFDALGCNGNEYIQTPGYDRLAARGVRFTNAFTPCPICVPARASIVSGSYPHRCTGEKDNKGSIKSEFPKLPEEFNALGYETYSMGKLHFMPYSAPGEPRLLYGYEHAEITESGRVLYFHHPDGKMRGLEDYLDYLEDVGWGGYSRAHSLGANEVSPVTSIIPEEHYVDTWVADRAIHYMREHIRTKKDKPFFMHASFPKPHAPYDPPSPWDSMYDPRTLPEPCGTLDMMRQRGHENMSRLSWNYQWDKLSPEAKQAAKSRYYGLISLQDKQVGRMLDFLEEEGLDDNTIIVATADHGDMMGDFGLFFKKNMYNGSVRIPLIISVPHQLAGTVCDYPATLCDLLPTLMELAGSDKQFENIDGISLCRAMEGEELPERYVVSECDHAPLQTAMITNGRYKYIYHEENGTEELYDQEADPHELTNLAESMPERTKMMRDMLRDWFIEKKDEGMIRNGELAQSLASTDPLPERSRVFGRRWY